MFDRNDTVMEVVVNRGIYIATHEGNAKGASFMAENNVPFSVAHRVLLRAYLRRDTDWR